MVNAALPIGSPYYIADSDMSPVMKMGQQTWPVEWDQSRYYKATYNLCIFLILWLKQGFIQNTSLLPRKCLKSLCGDGGCVNLILLMLFSNQISFFLILDTHMSMYKCMLFLILTYLRHDAVTHVCNLIRWGE